jgi:MerR HTH family regulatory protein
MIDLDAATYSTKDVSALATVTLRQLQVWDENRILVPVRRANNFRRYTVVQAVSAMIGRELRVRNLGNRNVRTIVRMAENAVRLAIGGQRWFVMVPYHSGGKGYVAHQAQVVLPDEVIAWTKTHGGCFAIAIHDLVDELVDRMDAPNIFRMR